MARIRTIKPDFWTDEKLTECSMSARLFFVGTWNFADDNGNLVRSAKKLKMQIFPADAIDCEPLIQELLAIGVMVEYVVDGEKYLHIKGFLKHQVINRPSKSSIPQAVLNESKEAKQGDSLSTHGGLSDGKEGKGREEEGKGSSVPIGTGAVAPEGLNSQEAIFQIAVPWLVDRGCKEGNIRSLLGGAVKQLGADAAWALASQCMTEKPIEPIAWLAAGINAQSATRGIGRKVPGGKGQPSAENFDAVDYGEAGIL